MKKKPQVLLIGDPMIDVYHYGKATRVSPEAPLIVFKKDHTVHALGGALNLGANLLAFCDVDFYCANYMGKLLLKDYIEVNDPCFIRKTRFIDIDYNIPTGLRFDEDLQYEEFTTFSGFSKIEENLMEGKYDFIALSDYDKGTIGVKCLNRLFKILGESKFSPIIFLDTKTSNFEKYKDKNRIDFFKPNEVEFRKYEKYYRDNVEWGESFFEQQFVTKSKSGISFYNGGNFSHECFNVPTFCKKLVDVTGAGDSAMAGLIYGYDRIFERRGKSPSSVEIHKYMAVCANAFAKLACENKGTFVITPQHLPAIEEIVKEYYRAQKKT